MSTARPSRHLPGCPCDRCRTGFTPQPEPAVHRLPWPLAVALIVAADLGFIVGLSLVLAIVLHAFGVTLR